MPFGIYCFEISTNSFENVPLCNKSPSVSTFCLPTVKNDKYKMNAYMLPIIEIFTYLGTLIGIL